MEIDEKKVGIKGQIVEVLKTCYDPEIPVDIYELGLIYDVDVDDDNNAYIKMTLTSPACPVAGSLPIEVENKVKTIDELNEVKVDVVWDPPWDQSMMSEAAKLELGFF
jgi:FeS assembly SUF system protein